MGFTKLDEAILRSSIMAAPASVFKVWIALLASCGSDGIARISSDFLARACYLPLRLVDNAIEVLSAKDDRSRSPNDDGRRIRRVDGGFFLINYEKYRAISYSENPESARKRAYRRLKKAEEEDTSDKSGTCPGRSASASASASKSYEEGRKTQKITFNRETSSWEGITEEKLALWSKAYPACDISQELARAAAWVVANPLKGHKSNWDRFITNWLSRTQDRGGTKGYATGTSPDPAVDPAAWFWKGKIPKGPAPK